MAFGSTPSDSNNIPIGSVYVPGVGFKALQGGTLFTDGSSNDSAPVRTEDAGGTKATYRYLINATAPGYATPQDWIVLRGSATKTIKVLHVEISGAITTAAGYIVSLKKHTIANTGGTSTNPTPIKHDSNDGTATGLILLYTVAPTTDATATIWQYTRLLLQAPSAATVADRYVYDYAAQPYEPLVLRGVAQELAFNLGGVAIGTGQVYDFQITWTEE
jgi:hypothetical protein